MNNLVYKLREELEQENKSLVHFDRCLDLLEDIEDEIEMLESQSQDFEDQNWDLERRVNDLECELEDCKISSNSKSKTLDDVYKEEIFEELSKKYSFWKLQELLKINDIL